MTALPGHVAGGLSCEGAWVEDKGPLMTFHYREVPLDKREPLIARAKELILEAGYKVRLNLFSF